MSEEQIKQVTVRLPGQIWEGVASMLEEQRGQSLNDLIVGLIEAELRRRQRERLLYSLAEERADLAGRHGVMEDSACYIRTLREGASAHA